jgi:hypothetical protein
MAARTLGDVDAMYGTSDLPWVIDEWTPEPTGVDPLGLRQVNLDMMDRLLPGINNVTRHVRVYTLMTWAWWKAGQALSGDGAHGVWSQEMRDYVERVDAIFSWSQFRMRPDSALPGSTVLPGKLEPPGSSFAYDFASPEWDKLRKSRRNSTDLLGAIQYGPSIRGAGGLGWLQAVDGVFQPTGDVMSAVEAFDAIVSPHLPKCLLDPSHSLLTFEDLDAIAPIWDHRAPDDSEREVFAERFFGNQEGKPKDSNLAKRRGTLRLMLDALATAGKPCSVETVRARMFGVDAPEMAESVLQRPRHRWRVLQIRQLQRLAIEATYISVEARLKAQSASTAEIVAFLIEDLNVASVSTDGSVATMLEEAFAGWERDPERSVFGLMDALVDAQGADTTAVAKLALASFRCVEILAHVEASDEHGGLVMKEFEREPDRLPLGLMLARLTDLRDRPAREMLTEMVEAWVFGQHLRWSVMRGGDGKQRLRVGLDEGGWKLLRGDTSATFGPTPDRLRSALRLCADCGLIAETAPGAELWTSVSCIA